MKTTRRQFLSAAVGSSAVVSFGAAPRFLLAAAEQAPKSGKDTVLVVLQLSGGNDGLNTIVPYGDDAYRRNRPKLAIATDRLLKIDDHFGLHPSLGGFANLLEAGKLGVVQGVGYPNPNRSHFESMDIWHTCHRKTQRRRLGWLGRYLDQALADAGSDVPALHLGGQKQPLALAARNIRIPSVQSLERFRLRLGGDQELQKAIEELADQPTAQEDNLLGFIQSSTTSALAASRRVEQVGKTYRTKVTYPETGLARKLRTVAQLIDAGLTTRIYYVALGGFDTHSQQAAAHSGLLRELASAVSAFIEDISHHGHAKRVLLMCFSEFGRRVKENASGGTDHGAAAPMFLAGGRVKPGLIGPRPSLTDLENGDLKFHTDFRQVYAAILENWLDWKSEPVLGAKFKPAPVLAG